MKVSKGNKLDLAKAARECASMAESVSGTIQSITQHWNQYCNAAALPEFITNEVFTRRAKLADFMRRMAESLESVADDKTINEVKEMKKIKRLALSWSVSRGRDSYGYNICRLDDTSTGDRFKCMGGGYDMLGTVFGAWLAANYQPELLAIKERASYYFSKEKGHESRDPQGGAFYGMKYYIDDNRVSLDGACGLDCMIRIAEAIGLEVERDYIAKGRRRGETVGWYVSEAE